jgi:hypothetical protein
MLARALALVLPTAMFLTACSPSAAPVPPDATEAVLPATPEPAPQTREPAAPAAAGSACTADDGRPLETLLQLHQLEWQNAVELAESTAPAGLDGPIGRLQEIRRVVEGEEWPACGRALHQALVRHMDARIALFQAFAAQDPSYNLKQRDFLRASEQLYDERQRAAGVPTQVVAREEPVSGSGQGAGQLGPFALTGGNYMVRWTARPTGSEGTCVFGGAVKSTNGVRLRIFGPQSATPGDPARGQEVVDALPPGDYVLAANGTNCAWEMSLDRA